MANEKRPLLKHSSYRAIDESYQTFFGDYSDRHPSCMTVFTRALAKAASRSRSLMTHMVIPTVHFANNQPESVSTRYHSSACFENRAFDRIRGPPLTQLEWLTIPVTSAVESCPMSPFSVQANPQVTEDVVLTVHACEDGAPCVTGETRVAFRSQGPIKPAVAVFRGIAIKRAGKYVLEVVSCGQPPFRVLMECPLVVQPNVSIQHKYLCRTISEELGHLSLGM